MASRLLPDKSPQYIDAAPKDSPYPEVRASVPNWDDPNIPQSTLRVWVIGFVLTSVLGCMNLLLSMQEAAYAVSAVLVIVAAHPFGILWAKMVPDRKVLGIRLNPGPFNIKEHGLIAIMGACVLGGGPSYLTLIMSVKRHATFQDVDTGFAILMIISTQLFALAFAGLVRRVLIYPAHFIFPSSLVTVTLLTNLHIKSNYLANGWGISRLRLLLILMCLGTIYQWIPGFFAQFLSSFSWASWISPENVVINQLFGAVSGVSLLPVTFDWATISGILGSPLVPPLGTLLNMATLVVLVMWIAIPVISFTNVWFGNYIPIVSSYSQLLDRYQQEYDITRVMTSKHFDQEKYRDYSPIFMSDANSLSYGLSFAAVTAAFTHFALFDARQVYRYWRSSHENKNDLHMQLMHKYPEVPFIVYAILFVIALVAGIITVHVYTSLAMGPLFLALTIAIVMWIPAGILYATTSMQLFLGVLAEFIAGYLQQGNSEANMIFKTFCAHPGLMGIIVLQFMKMAHYLKLSPRIVFYVQFFSLLWGGFLQWITLLWASHHFVDFCSASQPQGYTCRTTKVFYRSAMVWGTIGAERVLKIYRPVLLFFLIGPVLPALSWLWLRRYPRSIFRYLHWPVFFNSAQLMPPAAPYAYVTYLQAGFLFTFYIRRYYFNWWAKYNYTVSAGLELAVVMGSLTIALVQIGGRIKPPSWWGNVGYAQNADGVGAPRIVLSEGETFGPETW